MLREACYFLTGLIMARGSVSRTGSPRTRKTKTIRTCCRGESVEAFHRLRHGEADGLDLKDKQAAWTTKSKSTKYAGRLSMSGHQNEGGSNIHTCRSRPQTSCRRAAAPASDRERQGSGEAELFRGWDYSTRSRITTGEGTRAAIWAKHVR